MSNLSKAGGIIDHNDRAKPTRDQIRMFVDNPATAIPAEFRVPVLEFRCEWSDLLKSDLAVCVRVRRWIAEKGLKLEDLELSFGKLFDRAGEFEYAGQLHAALAKEVAAAIRDRQAREAMLDRREQDARERAEAAPPDAVKNLLAGIGRAG